MGEVVPIRTTTGPAAAFGRGEHSFLCCSCSTDEETGWIPVVVHEDSGWQIISLVCLACGREMRITDGREAVH